MRVTDHIYVLSGTYYAAVNDQSVLGDVYGVKTPDGMVLIDCGAPETGWRMIRETLDYYGITDPLTHVILTHGHWDHAGSAKQIQDMGAKIVVGAEDVFYCENGGNRGLATPFNDNHVFPAFKPDIVVNDGDALTLSGWEFKFIGVPGHTPGSMALYTEIDRKKVLFTGDAIQPDGRQLCDVSLGWQGDTRFSKADIVASMLRLMDFECDMLLPGHGKLCLRNGTKMLRYAARTAFLTLR